MKTPDGKPRRENRGERGKRGKAPDTAGTRPGTARRPGGQAASESRRPAAAPRPPRPQGEAGQGLAWTREGRLFPAPGPEAAGLLAGYETILKTVMPLRASHAKDLPSAIQSLSASLTTERGLGPKPGYLSDPRMLAAYAWYFLPWNLYRLTRLIRGLDLDLPDGAVVVDAGAGPLTLVQALWIAAPRLRCRRLTFLCLDRSRAALALGRELFLALAGEQTPWRVETVREELPRLPRATAHLVTAINVLNELAARRSQSLSEKTSQLAATLVESLVPGGRLLLVEPGVRASGKLLARLRESLVEDEELSLVAPCPHAGPCPLAARGSGTWCHFTVDAAGVPQWLETLSRRVGLPKRDVSLSFLFAADRGGPGGRADTALGRVVSNPFPVPGLDGQWARYACASSGLKLYVTPSRGGLVPGDLARTERAENPPRDRKSGAAILLLRAQPEGAPPREAAPGPGYARPGTGAPGKPSREPKETSREPKETSRASGKPSRERKESSRAPGKSPRQPKETSGEPRKPSRQPKESSRAPEKPSRARKESSRAPTKSPRGPKDTSRAEGTPPRAGGKTPRRTDGTNKTPRRAPAGGPKSGPAASRAPRRKDAGHDS